MLGNSADFSNSAELTHLTNSGNPGLRGVSRRAEFYWILNIRIPRKYVVDEALVASTARVSMVGAHRRRRELKVPQCRHPRRGRLPKLWAARPSAESFIEEAPGGRWVRAPETFRRHVIYRFERILGAGLINVASSRQFASDLIPLPGESQISLLITRMETLRSGPAKSLNSADSAKSEELSDSAERGNFAQSVDLGSCGVPRFAEVC